MDSGMDLFDWWNALFPGALAAWAMTELITRFFFWRRSGKATLVLGATWYNYAVLGIYLVWLIAARPFLSRQPLTLALLAAVTALTARGGLTRLQIREGGLANGFWRLPWPRVKKVEWQGNKLIVRGHRHPLHPDRFVWRIPDHRRAEVEALLRQHLAPDAYPSATAEKHKRGT